MKALFWICFAATTALYLTIVFWSLPVISAQAGGLIPFDMRPMGYSTEEARSFLSALSQDGREWYLGTQHSLDTVYPGLLGLTLAVGLSMVFSGVLAWVGVALSACVALSDYLENAAVAVLLEADATAVTDALVANASFWTLTKSMLSTVVFTLFLVGVLRTLWRRRKG